MIDLNDFRKRVYSQSGEDGLIEKLFKHLGIKTPTYVEIGGGNGKELSNTRLLWERGSTGVLIEGNPTEFAELVKFRKGDYLVNQYIDCEENTMDYWLSASPLPTDFDLFSLDIDGNDLWVWKSMHKYTPKAVLVEYNYAFTDSVTIAYDKAHRFNQTNYYGASASAFMKLAKQKGYELVGWTDIHNLLFLRKELCDGLKVHDGSKVQTGGGWPKSNRDMQPY